MFTNVQRCISNGLIKFDCFVTHRNDTEVQYHMGNESAMYSKSVADFDAAYSPVRMGRVQPIVNSH